MCDLFGGPSGTEKTEAAQMESLSDILNANYQTTFGEQQQALQQLSGEIEKIQTGQTGPGMSAQETAARTAQIQNLAAAQARNVQQAVQNRAAGEGGGGSSGLTSGITRQIGEEATSAAQTQEAQQLAGLTGESYAIGRQEAAQTVGGLEALSGAYGGAAGQSVSGAIGSGQAAFGEAKTIEQQQQEEAATIGGLAEGGLSALSGTNFAGNLFGGKLFGPGGALG